MFKMIAFIGGFVVCGIIAFVLYLVICKGITECIKDNEMTFAVYNNKEDARKSRETLITLIAFIGGFVVCGIIAFVLYLVICKGITECIKDNEMTFAVYNNKEDARKSRETLITL
uniref:Uncharacterized protein n=1 Tax=Vibrio phage Vc1 TaxID=1480731 RepID=A0A6M5CDR7_9CAUD